MDNESTPKLVEDPRFLCLRASVRLAVNSSDISKARADYQTAMDFKHCPDQDEILAWFRAETKSDSAEEMTREILRRVYAGKAYHLDFKAKIRFERACFLFIKGKADAFTDPHRATDLYIEALESHLEAFRVFEDVDSSLTSKSEEYCRNTAFTLCNHIKKSREADIFIESIQDIATNLFIWTPW